MFQRSSKILSRSITKSLSEISSEVLEFVTKLKCTINIAGKETTESTSTCKDIQTGILNLQMNASSRLESLQSLHRVPISCAYFKNNVENFPVANMKENENIKPMERRQLYQAITEVRDERKRTREQVAEMEKSPSTINEIDTFSTVSSKRKKNAVSIEKDSVSSEQQESMKVILQTWMKMLK